MTVDFTAELAAARVLAIIRGTDTAATVAAGRALLAEGVRLVEVASVSAAGAQFVVTPAVVESIPEAARRGLPVAAGAFTPTEAYTAVRQGASAVKLFPASLGGRIRRDRRDAGVSRRELPRPPLVTR